MAIEAMFPLGAVLFPHMPLRLRVFEERYLVMLSELLKSDRAEFGVVLIERGQEVGGGEHRFTVGTVAEVLQVGTDDATVVLVAKGGGRFAVDEWLPDDPHPRAEVTALPDLSWDPDQQTHLEYADTVVRRTLRLATEFDEPLWSGDIELSTEPLERAWQLAGIAPLGPLDQLTLLRSASVEELLSRLVELTEETMADFSTPWPDEPPT